MSDTRKKLEQAKTPQERRAAVYERMQEELKNFDRAQEDQEKNNLDSLEQSEHYREPLEITLYKEINIGLSYGGPADGFKLRYYKDELQGGVYYFQDWGTYDEMELTDDEAAKVESHYLYGDPSMFLNDNQE
jgi:hypothetical protein